MKCTTTLTALSVALGGWLATASAQTLPFKHKVEVYREKDGEVSVFALRLEQPFLAEEFEKSNYLRLAPLDSNAYLIYPKETKFQQKHAAFYGRLRGSGKARLRLSYETVLENLDGSRRVEVNQSELEVVIPTEHTGPRSIYLEWARRQNAHFLDLLTYYPHETFFQYGLMQSRDRYGVKPPALPTPAPTKTALETDLYQVMTGSFAIQRALQRRALSGRSPAAKRDVHISELQPPALRSLHYVDLLKEKKENEGVEPKVHALARFIPEDQYLLHFNSMSAAGEMLDLTREWGGSLLRLFSIDARHNHLQEKFEQQLLLQRGGIDRLFADGVIAEMAMTGADLFFIEGTDLALIFRLEQPAAFEKATQRWLAQGRERHPDLVEREFNYRGHKIVARYTDDRTVSSFVTQHEDTVVYCNSHVAVRRIVETLEGATAALHDAPDYRYVSTILPPEDDRNAGYFYASQAFIRRQIEPPRKISEKRRVECFNNLVMLNNASLLYRLETGKSPHTLSDLTEGKFIAADKLVCPHGGAYAFDAERDTGTCSLHNRLKLLTPNTELEVLRVSRQEQQEYERYKQRYAAFWQPMFDPVAVRIRVQPTVKLEVCVLPLANGTLYENWRRWLDEQPRRLDTVGMAESTVASLAMVPGGERIANYLRDIPGIPEVLAVDPTLTDLSWIGDRLSLHLCDDDTILEVDPSRLRPLDFLGDISVTQQSLAGLGMLAASLPTYVAIDVEDRDKARRFLDLLASKIFLKGDSAAGFATTFDAYRLPDYEGHAIYVVSYQWYALKLRLHVALIGDRLIAATKAKTLREVIDAADEEPAGEAPAAHMLLRLDVRTLENFKGDLRLYWAEKARLACHGNIMSIYNLIRLYDAPITEVDRLSEAKYGVTYFCPEGGTYAYDQDRDRVECSIHGNRQNARQNLGLSPESSFSRLVESLDEIVAMLRFRDDSLIATVEFTRRESRDPAAGR